jgi:nitroreductase
MNLINLIHNRFSPRAFSDQTVSQEQLELIFEAVRWAPSARNEQPWHYIYLFNDDSEKYHQILGLLSDWNQKWAQSAPVLVAGISELNYKHNNLPNEYAWYDLGQSVAYMTLQASEMGLHIHQMGGFDRIKAKKLFQLSDNSQVVVMMAIGYKGSLDRIPEAYHEAELTKNGRKSLVEMVTKYF